MIRIAGLAAWFFLVSQVMLGTVYSAGMGRLLIAPRWKLRLHRWATVGLLTAIALHITAIVNAHFPGAGLIQLLEIGPGSLGRNCGAISVWLLVVVALVRLRPLGRLIGPALSRRLHQLSYVVLALGTSHALLMGKDTTSLAIAGPGIACLSVLAAALVGRYHKALTRRRTRTRTPTPTSPGTPTAPAPASPFPTPAPTPAPTAAPGRATGTATTLGPSGKGRHLRPAGWRRVRRPTPSSAPLTLP